MIAPLLLVGYSWTSADIPARVTLTVSARTRSITQPARDRSQTVAARTRSITIPDPQDGA